MCSFMDLLEDMLQFDGHKVKNGYSNCYKGITNEWMEPLIKIIQESRWSSGGGGSTGWRTSYWSMASDGEEMDYMKKHLSYESSRSRMMGDGGEEAACAIKDLKERTGETNEQLKAPGQEGDRADAVPLVNERDPDSAGRGSDWARWNRMKQVFPKEKREGRSSLLNSCQGFMRKEDGWGRGQRGTKFICRKRTEKGDQ